MEVAPEVEAAAEPMEEPEAEEVSEETEEVVETPAEPEFEIIEEAVGEEAEAAESLEMVEEEVVVEAPEVEAEEEKETAEDAISEAISELMEKMEPGGALVDTSTEKVSVEESVAEKRDEYVDLSAELGLGDGVDQPTATMTSTRANETYDEFRTGLEKQLGREDSETHYNLGIAYMEMELYKEASKEFKVALKDPGLEFDCYTRLGLSATAESSPDEAIVYYLKALKVSGRTEEERKGCMYELAMAYEVASNEEEAAELFRSIHEIDPGYREVGEKVKLSAGVRAHIPHIPLDDGLIEVELL
jgi:tetratricopeptide (TPR) repeat protein